jgi:hypothetical protein
MRRAAPVNPPSVRREDQPHRHRLDRAHGVRHPRRQVQQFAGAQGAWFARDGELALATEHLDDRARGAGVLRECLPGRETEEHDPRLRGGEQGATDNAVADGLRALGQ